MRWNIPFLLASIAVAASPVQAAKPLVPIPLAHIGPWEVNFDDDSCHLIGTFGSGDDRIIAKFTRYQLGDGFDLALIGRPLRAAGMMSLAKLDFGPLADPVEHTSFNGTMGSAPAAVFNDITLIDRPKLAKGATLAEAIKAFEAAKITPEQEAAARDLTIQTNRGKSYRLVLGSMAAPMRTLRGCTTDLVRHWGLDPAEQASLSRRPIPRSNPGSWLNPKDYPADLLRKSAGGLVRFRLDITETGGITSCHIQLRTNPDGFADLTCKLIMRRAKFESAVDRNGKPIKSYYVESVRWQIPEF